MAWQLEHCWLVYVVPRIVIGPEVIVEGWLACEDGSPAPWHAAHVLLWFAIAVPMSAWSILLVVGAWHVAQAAWTADRVPLECVIAVRLVPVWHPVPPQESARESTSCRGPWPAVPWHAAHVLSWPEIAALMSAWSILLVVGAWQVAQVWWTADTLPLECVIAVRFVPVWQPVPPQESERDATVCKSPEGVP